VEKRKRRVRKKKKSTTSIRHFKDYSKVDVILGLCFLGLILVVSTHFLFKDYFSGVRFGTQDPGTVSSGPAGPDFRFRAPTPSIDAEPDSATSEEEKDDDSEESEKPASSAE
jgi:hypothetical protein